MADLKAALKGADLAITGNKSELVARYEEHLAAENEVATENADKGGISMREGTGWTPSVDVHCSKDVVLLYNGLCVALYGMPLGFDWSCGDVP